MPLPASLTVAPKNPAPSSTKLAKKALVGQCIRRSGDSAGRSYAKATGMWDVRAACI